MIKYILMILAIIFLTGCEWSREESSSVKKENKETVAERKLTGSVATPAGTFKVNLKLEENQIEQTTEDKKETKVVELPAAEEGGNFLLGLVGVFFGVGGGGVALNMFKKLNLAKETLGQLVETIEDEPEIKTKLMPSLSKKMDKRNKAYIKQMKAKI